MIIIEIIFTQQGWIHMKKLMIFSLISMTMLSGCSLKEANAKMKTEVKPLTHLKKISLRPSSDIDRHPLIETNKQPLFEPKATISISPITYDSTNVTLTTIDSLEPVSKIDYHIWRTADGPESMKKFSSNQKQTGYSYVFNPNEFSGKRGEFQVEAYNVRDNGDEELLAKSTFVFQQHVPILMYHAIDDYQGKGLKELFVTPANFEAQMSYLKENGYTLLTFEHWDEINKVNKPILVTFDDSMKNNLYAFRILQNLQDAHFQPAATEFAIAGSIDKSASHLSSTDLKEMADSGIFSIQSHTMTHADLPTITNYQEELEASKEKIEQITGKPVIAIAYPSGRFNNTVVEETKKYYEYAVTTKPGQFIEEDVPNELLVIHRVRISYSTTLNQFAAMVQPR
jgi:peptidoglycan/xylan/chitin deacetylase (PgdA/CDA1 family)